MHRDVTPTPGHMAALQAWIGAAVDPHERQAVIALRAALWLRHPSLVKPAAPPALARGETISEAEFARDLARLCLLHPGAVRPVDAHARRLVNEHRTADRAASRKFERSPLPRVRAGRTTRRRPTARARGTPARGDPDSEDPEPADGRPLDLPAAEQALAEVSR